MISFILPAHNEEQLLGETLDALRVAADEVGEAYEVIVVADACTDRTAEIAAAHEARVIQVHHRQIAATRNAGAREAKGDVFFFVDADTHASVVAIRMGLQTMRGGTVGGGFVPRFDGPLPLWFRIASPFLAFGMRRLRLVGGCFLFCTRDAFQAAGGFCEQYYASEETAFIKALKRQGPFIVPPGEVMTSGRKLRMFSAWQIAALILRCVIRGPQSFQQRDGLEVWYGERRGEEA
jgi:glycosyltransferase involved in cell wall biosynthesis